MSNIKLDNIKPLRDDVLVKREDNKKSTIIHTIDKRDEGMLRYKVVKVGKDAKYVKPGDSILLQYGDHMEPFEVDTEMYAITNESRIVAIL